MTSVYLIMGLHILTTTFMTIGLFTPVSTAITFVTLRSISNRNPLLCNGGDNVAKIMCFYLIFAPSGHAYSLDEILFYAPHMPNGEYLTQAPWALRLMQIQVSIIYLYAALWKLKGRTYRNGTALYYALSNHRYRKFSVPQVLSLTPYVQLLTWSTLTFELVLGPGLWIEEFRCGLIAMGIAFHMTIEYMLNVHLFSWYMIACLLLFVDPSQIFNLL
ncbi:MAG: HTTM domain-containing protein [Bacteroidota bacterium]